ncbi:anti-virulence regulator CigR family protein [Pantoea sp.]|uniref:anti-virulence regulator CigR family protein n=1 Tax=Pantoea sp. TaxID=69393 RepID=UPI0028AA108C|nr:anti-virulence regulator CigR family protein [Pantoea sp.]
MQKHRPLVSLLALVLGLAVFASPGSANPGNGNGNGNGHHGNKGAHGNQGRHDDKPKKRHQGPENRGQPDRVGSDINFSRARTLAVNYGLVNYPSLPPGIAKQVARGKPLPPGIAKKSLPASMINELPYYPGYEWRAVGNDLVLIALSTAVVTAVINGVFD